MLAVQVLVQVLVLVLASHSAREQELVRARQVQARVQAAPCAWQLAVAGRHRCRRRHRRPQQQSDLAGRHVNQTRCLARAGT